MSQPADSRNHFSPDDALPEVVAPNASFLLPLFVVPLCIVTIIVMVWVAFNWVALKGSDAASDIAKLGRPSDARWQAAANFADRLRNPRNTALRRDSDSAGKVAAILQAELDRDLSGKEKSIDEDVNLRVYLCRALGEFEVPAGLPVLLDAASGKGAAEAQQLQNLPVRRAAIEGISVLISNVRAAGSPLSGDPFEGVLPVLSTAAAQRDSDVGGKDEMAPLRYTAAFALGVLGGEAALARLEPLLIDAHPDVRYNAACGLARNGDPRAALGLTAMLDPADARGVRTEQAEVARPMKRATIYRTALQATAKLLDENQADRFETLESAVRSLLAEEKIDKQVRLLATEVLIRFDSRKVAVRTAP